MTEWEDVERQCRRANVTIRDDTTQLAWIYWRNNPHRTAWRIVSDAMRQILNVERLWLTFLRDIDYVYAAPANREKAIDRLLREESEDQLYEWFNLPSAERDKRILESCADLGTSPTLPA